MARTDDDRALRDRLVAEIVRRGRPWRDEAWDPRVLEAVRAVPRHLFVPELSLDLAYRDGPQPIGEGQTISQPTVVAIMAQALELAPSHRVLEIGTGCGYHAAVLSLLAGSVFSIEVRSALAARARERLAALGYDNVTVLHGDGYLGWPEHAPFDRIVLTAAPPEVPEVLFEQLAVGGVLVAPIGVDGALQRLARYRRQGRVTYSEEDLGGVMFVPMVHTDD